MSNSTNAEILVAGALAAFTVDLLVYPLDTIKTRIQSQDYLGAYASSASRGKPPPAYVLRGLYQGVGSVIVATLPAAGTFFTVYESAKTLLTASLPDSTPQPLVHSLASGTAELCSCLILAPAEVIKQNAQVLLRDQQQKASGGDGSTRGSTSLQAFRMLQHAEGGAVRRLWTGYTALAARNLPFTAMQFPVFEAVRARVWAWRDGRRPSSSLKGVGGVARGQGILETGLVNGASAGLSGAFAALLTTPSDVVKTRMMLSAGGDGSKRGQRMSGYQVATLVYRERGVRGLFRGGALRAVWTAVGSALYLGTYEAAKVWLRGGKAGLDDAGI